MPKQKYIKEISVIKNKNRKIFLKNLNGDHKNNKNREKRRQWNREVTEHIKTTRKMLDCNPNTTMTTMNRIGLNTKTTKLHEVARPNIQSLQKTKLKNTIDSK